MSNSSDILISLSKDTPINFTTKDNNILVPVVPLKHGLKLECTEDMLNDIKNNEEITDKFQLNIIRLNSCWYSVYFQDKNSVEIVGKEYERYY